MHLLRRFISEQSGAHAIEMAIVAPTLFLPILGGLEFGLIMYSSSLLDTITAQAARYGKTGFDYGDGTNKSFASNSNEGFASGSSDSHYSVDSNGNVTMRSREAFIRDYIRNTGSALLKPENITVSTRFYTTVNLVGLGMQGTPYNAGGSSDIVLYTVRYDWPILTPLMYFIGTNGKFPITSTMVVKNE